LIVKLDRREGFWFYQCLAPGNETEGKDKTVLRGNIVARAR
jgi:hypothetical protein